MRVFSWQVSSIDLVFVRSLFHCTWVLLQTSNLALAPKNLVILFRETLLTLIIKNTGHVSVDYLLLSLVEHLILPGVINLFAGFFGWLHHLICMILRIVRKIEMMACGHVWTHRSWLKLRTGLGCPIGQFLNQCAWQVLVLGQYVGSRSLRGQIKVSSMQSGPLIVCFLESRTEIVSCIGCQNIFTISCCILT